MSRGRLILIGATAIGALGAAAVAIGLVHLFQVGTCASGGPYAIALPCPSGTGAQIGLLMGGIIASVVACLVISMSADTPAGAWQIPYSLLFLGAGFTVLVDAATTHGLAGGAQFGAWTIAAVFIPMGLWPPLVYGAAWAGGSENRRLEHRGVTTVGTLATVRTLERFPTGEQKVELIYRVKPRTSGSLSLSRVINVVGDQLPAQGQTVQIRYDPRHPERFTVLGDAPAVRVR